MLRKCFHKLNAYTEIGEVCRGLGKLQKQILQTSGAHATYWECTNKPLILRGWNGEECKLVIECQEQFEAVDYSPCWYWRVELADGILHVEKFGHLIPCMIFEDHVRVSIYGDLFSSDHRETDYQSVRHNLVIPDEIKAAKNASAAALSRAYKSLQQRRIVTPTETMFFTRSAYPDWRVNYKDEYPHRSVMGHFRFLMKHTDDSLANIPSMVTP